MSKTTLAVFECSEFHSLGEIHENIKSVDEALKIWDSIPSSRMNGIKSIAVCVEDKGEVTEYEAVVGKYMDLDMLRYYPEVMQDKQAVLFIKELEQKMPDVEVSGRLPEESDEARVRPKCR